MIGIEAVKAVVETAKQVHDNELKATLLSQLIEVQQTALSQDEEIRRLRDENAALRAKLGARQNKADLLSQYERKGNAYWKDGQPYCVRCLEEGEAHTLVGYGGSATGAYCPTCNSKYHEIFGPAPRIGSVRAIRG